MNKTEAYKWIGDKPDPLGTDQYGRNISWVKDREEYEGKPKIVATNRYNREGR